MAVNQKDEPIASISVVNHTSDFAFLGLYIVAPDFRGRGTGFALWNHALKHAGNRVIGLDGVEAQQENYRTSGFVSVGSTTRFTGQLTGQRQDEVRSATPDDIPALIEMEAHASGVVKSSYLGAWFSQAATRSTLILESQKQISGLATIRACNEGAKIGPIIAADADAAHKLNSHAATMFDGPLTVDVPEFANGLMRLCQRLSFERGFRTARMYRGNFLPPMPETFAVASLELG